MITNQKPNIGQYLILAFFILTPFTWSYLTLISGFLVRPIDLVAITILLYSFSRTTLLINPATRYFSVLLFLLLFWLLFNFLITGDKRAFITFLKVSFYGFTTIALAGLIVRTNMEISSKAFLQTTIALFIFIVALNPQVFNVFGDFAYNLIINPARAIFTFWHELFKINLFGPSGEIEINGVSFRNTAALGFLAFTFLVHGFVNAGLSKVISIPLLIFIVLICMSRTAIICGCFWIMMSVAVSSNQKKPLFFFIILLGLIVLLQFAWITDTLEERFSGGLGGRLQMYVDGFALISEKPFLGHGSNASVSHTTADRTIHNVVIALGAEYGLPAFFISASLILFNVFSIFYFMKRSFRSLHASAKKIYVIGASAAFVTTSRPMLSASSENFYSLAEWACMAIILACYDPRLKMPVKAG